jgi:hypothetical protein
MPDDDTLPSDRELLELIAVAKWHYSKGYDRKDGQRVGTHSYILFREEPELCKLLYRRINTGSDTWAGKYLNTRYRYLTLGDGLTYWHMGTATGINRDMVNRAEREIIPKRRAAAQQQASF